MPNSGDGQKNTNSVQTVNFIYLSVREDAAPFSIEITQWFYPKTFQIIRLLKPSDHCQEFELSLLALNPFVHLSSDSSSLSVHLVTDFLQA